MKNDTKITFKMILQSKLYVRWIETSMCIISNFLTDVYFEDSTAQIYQMLPVCTSQSQWQNYLYNIVNIIFVFML